MERGGRARGIVLALAVSACGSNVNNNGTPPLPPPPPGVTVETIGTTFVPANVTVDVGTRVTWINPDGVPHTVTSGVGTNDVDAGRLFDLPLSPGTSAQYRFSTPGTYAYFCRIHETMNMRGTVTVAVSGTRGTSDAAGTGGN